MMFGNSFDYRSMTTIQIAPCHSGAIFNHLYTFFAFSQTIIFNFLSLSYTVPVILIDPHCSTVILVTKSLTYLWNTRFQMKYTIWSCQGLEAILYYKYLTVKSRVFSQKRIVTTTNNVGVMNFFSFFLFWLSFKWLTKSHWIDILIGYILPTVALDGKHIGKNLLMSGVNVLQPRLPPFASLPVKIYF